MWKVWCSVLLVVLCEMAMRSAAQPPNNDDLYLWKKHSFRTFSDAQDFLEWKLNGDVSKLMKARAARVASLTTQQEALNYQKEILSKFKNVLWKGLPFPKTDLKPQITGTLVYDTFQIQKIVIQTHPDLYVTCALFLPKVSNGMKSPAILFASGHAQQAFRADLYQTALLNLVNKGFVVFAFDPVGEGERVQYWDPATNQSRVGSDTAEHTYLGTQMLLNGAIPSSYWIWDAHRALDYLVSRPEVDTTRIGMFGHSGGGTLTAYMSAFDDRINASAPACYITTFIRLMESSGPQDAEQIWPHGIASSLDLADLIEARAPKPTLMVTQSDDQIFWIQGARETFKEAQGFFGLFNAKSDMNMVEGLGHHNIDTMTREAAYAFFQKYLHNPGNSSEINYPYILESVLQVTPTGQVATSYNSKQFFDLNLALTKQNTAALNKARQNVLSHLAKVQSAARQVSGYLEPHQVSTAVFYGRLPYTGYFVEKYMLGGEGNEQTDLVHGLVIPLLVFIPATGGPTYPAIIYISPQGKVNQDTMEGGYVETLLKLGYIVACPDLSGYGEMSAWLYDRDSYDNTGIPFQALFLGRSIVGIQAADIVRINQYLHTRSDVDWSRIHVAAFANATVSALHAVALDSSLQSLALAHPILSYEQIASNEYYNTYAEIDLFGVLLEYDLADLIGVVAPRKVLSLSPKNELLNPASSSDVQSAYQFAKTAYDTKKAAQNFVVHPGDLTPEQTYEYLTQWFKSLASQ